MFWLCLTTSSFDCTHNGNSSESIYDTCGPRRHMAIVLRLFIVCYKRESAKSYPKRHMRHYGRWWCGSCITGCGKRQWFGWKFTGTTILPDVLGNFLQLLQYCSILHYMIVTLFLAYPYPELPHTLTKPNWTINNLSYNPTQVNKTNIKLLKVDIQLTLNNKP